MDAVWTPTQEDINRVIQEQNPWRASGVVPNAMARTVERSMGRSLWRSALRNEPRRFQVILGPRRVGKTTVMYQTVRHLLAEGVPPGRLFWLRLDHPLLLRLPLDVLMQSIVRSGAATMEHPVFVFLDELVYATDWDLWLKTFYDEQYPVRIVATSSATAALRTQRPDSGVGRWEEQCLMPYLFAEFLDLALGDAAPSIPVQRHLHESIRAVIDMPALAPAITTRMASLRRVFLFTGGFPELLLSIKEEDETSLILESQRILRADAVERAIYKDIPQTFAVSSPLHLERLLYVLAGRATGVLSPTNICKELDQLSQPTFDRYLSYFERAFLVFTLPNYSGRETAVQKRGRKLYFVDGAIRNAALQRGLAPLSNPTEMGILLENVAAAQLNALAVQSQVRLFHWRETQDAEVDLVYDHPEYPMAFEIGASVDHPRKGLMAFIAKHPRFEGRCYLIAPDAQLTAPESSSSGVGTVPMDLFLLIVGRQAEAALQARLAVGESLSPT